MNKQSNTLLFDTEENIQQVVEYLKEKNITDLSYSFNEEKDLFGLEVSNDQYEQAKELLLDFLHNELEEEDDNEIYSSNKTFVKSKDKYEDAYSSALILIFVGSLVLIIAILEITGVLDFRLADQVKWLFYTVMFGMFIAFSTIGIFSLKSAKSIKKEIYEEEEFTTTAKTWFSNTYSTDDVDANIADDITDELKYYQRFEFMKQQITREYGDLDESYLDLLIEEIYQDLYE